ncbi:MAG: glycosyltransferase family 4 protein [Candidatus Thermoplasmatota archaeon]|nr:glycosyltransferase family 4 protein [Candidatus Thermoplasmatota archaeon]
MRFKDKLWNEIHGIERMSFNPAEYLSFNVYSWKTADVLLQNIQNYDIFYIHDFQQLQIGNFVGPFAPAVYRWHIPANFDSVSERIRKFVIRNMEAYDALIVSTKKDLEALFRSGYRGIAYQVYPYIDESEWFAPTAAEISEFRRRTGLNDGDRFFLIVARMDPIKGQDVAIRAMKLIHQSFPEMKLVLVGNGSFSGSSTGGLGSSKASNWRKTLTKLISDLHLENNVVLAGHMDDSMLRAAYSQCECLILPSKAEGFGLVTIEAWTMHRPVIVSSGAGSSELVVEGINGYTFPAGSDAVLAERMRDLLQGDRTEEMGNLGFETAKQCYVDSAIKKLMPIFEKAMSSY